MRVVCRGRSERHCGRWRSHCVAGRRWDHFQAVCQLLQLRQAATGVSRGVLAHISLHLRKKLYIYIYKNDNQIVKFPTKHFTAKELAGGRL